jgi:hypothetical protein
MSLADVRAMFRLILLHLVCFGVCATQAADVESDKTAGELHSAARAILAGWDDPEVGKAIDEFGETIAVRPDDAEALIRMLSTAPSLDAVTLQAELLVWIARGDETPSWKLKKMKVRPRPMETERFGPLAGELLSHSDPFVRGLAEWAIAIRLHKEYECAEERVGGRRVARQWPGEDAPDWYRAWAAIGPAAMLELDYVRQAAALGAHRTTATLLNAAQGLVQRSKRLNEYAERVGNDTKPHHEGVLAAFGRLQKVTENSPTDLSSQRKLYLDLRRAVREVVLANPDIDFEHVVFGVRQAPQGNGNITVGRWNTHTPGGDIYVKQGLAPEDPVEPLLDGRLGPGHVRGMELHWDADRLVFAYAPQNGRANAEQKLPKKNDFGGYFGQGVGAVEEMSHLYEVNLDGSGLRQLTDEPLHADQEPAYLPNGDIVFVSDRSYYGSQCAGALEQDNMILNLYRCDSNGQNIRPLSNNKDFDRHPHVMDTGQLLFLHWEYQERHLWQTHTLWTCRPDGSMTDALYKQHIPSGPMSLREARQIFGQRKLAAIACGHHNYDQGAVFLINYAQGINDRHAMRSVTPGVSETEGGYGGVKPVEQGGVQDHGGHYMFPYPLSEKSFLVSYSYKRPDRNAGQNFSLYYIDVWGNKELLHRDKRMSVAFLSPLKPVGRPPLVEELPRASSPSQHAVAAVANVHAGWPDKDGRRIKYLRISQKVPWPCVKDESKSCGFNDLHWMPAAWDPVLGMWDWGTARVIGIVPVEDDGSAHFKVPANQTVYFHALDENFLELRRMRSNVTFTAGETRSCVGCHESRATTPPRATMPLAVRREPSTPEPPPWGDRIVPDYERHIQPILDRHCTRCHGETEPDGGLEFTSRHIDGYMQSYRTIFGLKADDATPIAQNFWSIWRPNEPAISDEEHNAAKSFLRNILRKPPPNQLVTVADYTGGSEVTEPRQFGSANSKLTLTLLNDPLHRNEVKLSDHEWISLVTWVDLNAQYWGTFVEKDQHYASRRRTNEQVVPPRRVHVLFPDPWVRPPAGEWMWIDDQTVGLR